MVSLPPHLCPPTARAALVSVLTAGQTTHLVCFPVPLSLHVSVFLLCVSVLGKVPADLLLLLTASTSAPPDLGETVIVSTSALNGSAGCFWSTQLVNVYLFSFFFLKSAPLAAVGRLPDVELLAL